MALSRKLTKTDKTTPSVEDLIMKGGTSGADTDAGQEDEQDEDIKRVQLRISDAKLHQIDKIRKKRPGKLSRHTWIMEAIEEKLSKDVE